MAIDYVQLSGWVPDNGRAIAIGDRIVVFAGSTAAGSAGRYAIFDLGSASLVGAWEVTLPIGSVTGVHNVFEWAGRACGVAGVGGGVGGVIVSVDPATGGAVYLPGPPNAINRNYGFILDGVICEPSAAQFKDIATGTVTSAPVPNGALTPEVWPMAISSTEFIVPGRRGASTTRATWKFNVATKTVTFVGWHGATGGPMQPARVGNRIYWAPNVGATQLHYYDILSDSTGETATGVALGRALVAGADGRLYSMHGTNLIVWDPSIGFVETVPISPTRTAAASAVAIGTKLVFPCWA